MLCLGMDSNVMNRFIVQAFQDPPLCGSTLLKGSVSRDGELTGMDSREFWNVKKTYLSPWSSPCIWLVIFCESNQQIFILPQRISHTVPNVDTLYFCKPLKGVVGCFLENNLRFFYCTTNRCRNCRFFIEFFLLYSMLKFAKTNNL